ncbi:hypothetical protein KBC89_03510 [Candidatus Woesebacteria bacterium]|nr:hypothetical protein [Candidatus Woesebacteria bacterium]
MDIFKRYLTITKVDEEQRMVFGYATTPDLDSDGEIISIDAVKAALPGYMKFPTLREMHQAKAVGTIKEADIKGGEGLWIGAKVVADDAWKLVKEGVYKAFSIGGNVLKKAGNVITGLELVEISLVDVPANKAAVIELWKSGKITKTAEMVYSLSSLMIQAKDMCAWLDMQDKKKECKQMEKIVEQIKALIAIEATEPEKEDENGPMMYAQQIDGLAKHINELSEMEFPEDRIGKLADMVRKGVIVTMNQKAEELEKAANDAKAKLAEVLAKPVADRTEDDLKVLTDHADHLTDEQKTQLESEKPVETPVVTPAEAEVVETPVEEKDASKDESMQKLGSIDETLEKIATKPGVVVEDAVEKQVSVETITKITDTISKVADTLKTLSDRLEKIEKSVANIPAAAKSKAAYVVKTISANDGGSNQETVVVETDEVKTMKARLEELKKLRNELGANEFGKKGYSLEAVNLLKKLKG